MGKAYLCQRTCKKWQIKWNAIVIGAVTLFVPPVECVSGVSSFRGCWCISTSGRGRGKRCQLNVTSDVCHHQSANQILESIVVSNTECPMPYTSCVPPPTTLCCPLPGLCSCMVTSAIQRHSFETWHFSVQWTPEWWVYLSEKSK